MGKFLEFLKDKKNLTSLLILGILILALPLLKSSLEKQKIIQSRATEDPVVFVAGDGVSQREDGKWVSTKTKVPLKLTSPLGPAGTAAPIQAPTARPTAAPTARPTAAPTARPTAAPTAQPTVAPAVSWSGNLLSNNMQNTTLNKGSEQKVQWFADSGTYTLSGSVSSTPSNSAFAAYAVIQADEYTGDKYISTHANNTTFTVPAGNKVAVILRAINAKATYTNVSLTSNQSQNLLSSSMKSATINSGSEQKVQWFANPGTYSLSGSVSSNPILGISTTVAVIQADEYTGNTFVATHANNTTFTVPAGNKVAVILRVINANATFSNVSLKKQQ